MKLSEIQPKQKFTTHSGTEFEKLDNAKSKRIRGKTIQLDAECVRTDTGEVYFLPDLVVFEIKKEKHEN